MDFLSPQAWAVWALTAVAAYLGAYASEKGKRRAAREDKNQILEELSKTTRTLKEIEAKISLGVWQEQKRWDERRDSYARLLVWMDKIYAALLKIPRDIGDRELFVQVNVVVQALSEEFRRARSIARLFLPEEEIEIALDVLSNLYGAKTQSEALRECGESIDQFTRKAQNFFSP